MKIQLFLLAAFVAAIPYATADEPLRIAVASNFASQLKIAVSAYRVQDSDSGEISISVGSTGKLFAQIKQGAPFDLFFAADQPRPAQLYDEGFTAGPKPNLYRRPFGVMAPQASRVDRIDKTTG
jgi:ABC-type molybdate transport system substrate-binding protein